MYTVTDISVKKAMEDIRKQAVRVMEKAIDENKKEVLKAWKTAIYMRRVAEKEGALALEDKIVKIQKSNAPLCDYLTDLIYLQVDAVDMNIMMEIMVNDFYTRTSDDVTTVVLYMYMDSMQKIRTDFKESRDNDFKTVKKLSVMVRESLELIPEKYKEEFTNSMVVRKR